MAARWFTHIPCGIHQRQAHPWVWLCLGRCPILLWFHNTQGLWCLLSMLPNSMQITRANPSLNPSIKAQNLTLLYLIKAAWWRTTTPQLCGHLVADKLLNKTTMLLLQMISLIKVQNLITCGRVRKKQRKNQMPKQVRTHRLCKRKSKRWRRITRKIKTSMKRLSRQG